MNREKYLEEQVEILTEEKRELVMRLEMMLAEADFAELTCSNLAELATPAAKKRAKEISMGLRVECAEARALLARVNAKEKI